MGRPPTVAMSFSLNVMLPDLSGVAPPALTSFLHSMTPLLAGERMLVAVPFGLEVH